MKLTVQAIGVLGPGLDDWASALAVLRGEAALPAAATAVPPPLRLPPAERRRVGQSVRLALAVAEQVFAQVPHAPATTASVFASSGGDGENCDALCRSLAEDVPHASPTRFTNSVHNAPAGYWSIAAGATGASTSVCAFDASFAAGLLEAAIYACCEDEPVALIAYDMLYPQPLHALRPVLAPFAAALVLVPGHATSGLARIELSGYGAGTPAAAATPALEALRVGVPAARCLPLLEAIARFAPAGAAPASVPPAGIPPAEVALEALPGQVLRVGVSPCR